jgi:hypothetical protein
MLTNDEIECIRAAAEWNEENKEFVIPPFIVRNKKVNFPKLT